MGTILIVDDEPLVLELAEKLFTAEGYRVFVAGSAQAALAILNSHEGVDLVITDYSMPGTDGAQLAIRIQENYPKVFVIIISGFGQTLQINRVSVEMIVDKPIDFDLLLQKVQKLIGPR